MKQLCAALICLTLGSGCVTTTGLGPSESIEDQRKAILKMKSDVLQELYTLKPEARKQVERAPGYAVFSDANINIILASFGGGSGVAVDKKNGKPIYMHMGEVGIGIGLGVKDFRQVFIFHTEESLARFIDHGWGLGAQADAAAKADDLGVAVAGEISVDSVTIYQLTKSGLALQATVKGTKYWKSDELND